MEWLVEFMTDHLPEATKGVAMHNSGDRRDLRSMHAAGSRFGSSYRSYSRQLARLADASQLWFQRHERSVRFVSGYTCMLAYGGALREQGWLTIVTRALRRAWEIYVAFLFLLIAYFIVIWTVGGGGRYLDETNTKVFFESGNGTSRPIHSD